MPGNFLFPKKLAKEANAQALNELKNAEESKAFKIKQETEAAQASADKINGKAYLFWQKRVKAENCLAP